MHFETSKILTIAKHCCFCSRRHKGVRFKPVTAKVRQMKSPTSLALDHFDFYYAPLFGKKWPSIRLGLLTPNKFVAIINRFSKNFETNTEMIKDIGTVELIGAIVKGTETMSERVQKKKLLAESELQKTIQNKGKIEYENDQPIEEENDLSLRLDTGLKQFRETNEEFSIHELKHDSLENTTIERKIRDDDFKVTGLEGMSAEKFPFVEDFIFYPRNLRLMVFGRGCLDPFPAPIKDSDGWWLLDGGSVLPVLALDLQENDVILDMCAAPGGKTRLVCNDAKLERLGHLRRALGMYIPNNCDEANKITIKRKDASSVELWDELEVYDKVLLDAPCSTDRLSASQDEGNLFTTSMTMQRLDLPQLQTRLLV